jgi:hypothetical protein
MKITKAKFDNIVKEELKKIYEVHDDKFTSALSSAKIFAPMSIEKYTNDIDVMYGLPGKYPTYVDYKKKTIAPNKAFGSKKLKLLKSLASKHGYKIVNEAMITMNEKESDNYFENKQFVEFVNSVQDLKTAMEKVNMDKVEK